jgi:hypothetical protein
VPRTAKFGSPGRSTVLLERRLLRVLKNLSKYSLHFPKDSKINSRVAQKMRKSRRRRKNKRGSKNSRNDCLLSARRPKRNKRLANSQIYLILD